MKLKSFTIIALGLICTTFAFSQEEKIDTLALHEQRISLVEDGLLQVKKLKISGYRWQRTIRRKCLAT